MKVYLLVGGQRSGELINADSEWLSLVKQDPVSLSKTVSEVCEVKVDHYRLRKHATLGWIYVHVGLSDCEAADELERLKEK